MNQNSLSRRELSGLELMLLSPSPRLYVNGRQQVLLRVRATMKEGSTEVPLTETEIASLRIVLDTYSYVKGEHDDDNNAVVPREAFKTLGVYGEWESSKTDKEYAEFPAGHSGEHDNAFASFLRRQDMKAGDYFFFLSCRKAGRVRSVPFTALLKTDDGDRYCTNKKRWDAAGTEFSWSGGGGPVMVDPVDPPKLTAEHITAPPDAEPPEHGFYNIVHPFSIVYEYGGRPVGQKSMTAEHAGIIQWPTPDYGQTQASFTGYAPPGATAYTFNPANPTGPQQLPVPLPRPDQGAIVLCGRNDVDYQDGTINGNWKITIMDIYGNEHKVSVAFSSPTGNGRHSLTLTVL
ncbi:hypothetical protein ACQRKX_004897 [Enterobacter cloacae]